MADEATSEYLDGGLNLKSESLLSQPVVERLKQLGCRVRREVPVNGKRVDVLGSRRGEFIAVELKLRKWREALYQAFIHRCWSDLSYIAVDGAIEHLVLNNQHLFEDAGVGAYVVHDPEEEPELLISARTSRTLNPKTRAKLKDSLGFEVPA